MRDLNQSESDAIKKTTERLGAKREVVALCAYGSQVAGYATRDSDYDILMVIRPFKQKVRYYYLKSDAECSVLVVDPKSFESDCKKSTLGEFVSGRLLNAYYPIIGKEYVDQWEIEFKRRVILEGLSEAYADYSDFASEIIFPLSYFLFEKLRKRATIYPPVVYSYSKTYGDDLLLENLEFALRGLRSAAKELARDSLIEYDEKNDNIIVAPNQFHAGLISRIGIAASYTNKSIRQYAVHGYAGRVTPKVVGKEVLSKISRSRRSGRLPEYIQNPKISWSISKGTLFTNSHDWLTDLLKHLGLDRENCKISHKSLGEFYNSAGFYTIQDDKTALRIAVKRYQDVKGMKWGVLNIWSLNNANFTIDPMQRMFREYIAYRQLPEFGLHTPEIVAVFLDQKILVTKFVDGRDLSKHETEYLNNESDNLIPFKLFGRALGVMHNNDYCMGDTKPSNAILSDDSKIFFADLEQAQRHGNKIWDLAEFIYYSARFTLKEERLRKIIEAFVKGYESSAHNPSIIANAAGFRYRAPFQAFIAPNVMRALQSDLKDSTTFS